MVDVFNFNRSPKTKNVTLFNWPLIQFTESDFKYEIVLDFLGIKNHMNLKFLLLLFIKLKCKGQS